MTRLEIESKVKEVVALQFGVELDDLKMESHFNKDLNADSLDAVELVMCIEDRFDISIPDDDANNIITVKSVVDFVEKKLADKSGK